MCCLARRRLSYLCVRQASRNQFVQILQPRSLDNSKPKNWTHVQSQTGSHKKTSTCHMACPYRARAFTSSVRSGTLGTSVPGSRESSAYSTRSRKLWVSMASARAGCRTKVAGEKTADQTSPGLRYTDSNLKIGNRERCLNWLKRDMQQFGDTCGWACVNHGEQKGNPWKATVKEHRSVHQRWKHGASCPHYFQHPAKVNMASFVCFRHGLLGKVSTSPVSLQVGPAAHINCAHEARWLYK